MPKIVLVPLPEDSDVKPWIAHSAAQPFETPLTLAEEQKFQEWKQKYAPRDSGTDYDLRGAFKAGLTPDPQTGHWPDTFKKPNHPTFSNESKYAVGENAKKAGRWDGDTFIPPTGMVAAHKPLASPLATAVDLQERARNPKPQPGWENLKTSLADAGDLVGAGVRSIIGEPEKIFSGERTQVNTHE